MSLEQSPARAGQGTDTDAPAPADGSPEFWHALVDERTIAKFLGLTVRTMQALRQRGGGPQYVRVSARCIRYRRAEVKSWADARVRTSTSDPSPVTAAASSPNPIKKQPSATGAQRLRAELILS